MKTSKFIFSFLFVAIIFSCANPNIPIVTGFTPPPNDNRDRLFDDNWLFYRGDLMNAENPDFLDSEWRQLTLPHDWSIENVPLKEDSLAIGPFSSKSQGHFNTGYTIGGIGWYRKHFEIEDADNNKNIFILFDGVYMNSEVWINGHYLGKRPSGYAAFYYDLTSYLNPVGKKNILAVKVSNLGDNSRWYTGSGIYRHVYLSAVDKVHFRQWGVAVSTPQVSAVEAKVKIAVSVQNTIGEVATVRLRSIILSPEGKEVAGINTPLKDLVSGENKIDFEITVGSPALWSDSSPSLYLAKIEIWKDNKLLDVKTERFGIRSLVFDPENGFLVNGKPVKLRGACIHHDNGIIGSVTYERAEQRKLEILKANGFNAIRTSHNPPSTTLLNACDQLGIYVIDEAFDAWREAKAPQEDSHLYFQKWWKEDLQTMIDRDRNHPSVILWSVGNEIPESDPSWFLNMADSMAARVKVLDDTRPATQAICCHNPDSRKNTQDVYSLYKVQSYNYEWQNYEKDKNEFSDRIFIGTETFPKQVLENEQVARKFPWVIGDFVWTGFDHFGENGIGRVAVKKAGESETFDELSSWPWFVNWCGDIDVCGFKKPQSYYRDVVWGLSPIEILVHSPISADSVEIVSRWGWPDEFPHWTWPGAKGKVLKVNVYSRCEEVRLELNDEAIGNLPVSEETKLTATFNVPYHTGTLKAIGLVGGKEVETKEITSSGKVYAIRLSPDRSIMSKNKNDLSYVKIEVVDKEGNFVPSASNLIRISVSGQGNLIATGNASPTQMQSFSDGETPLFHGIALAIIRPVGVKGTVKIKAVSEGLISAENEIEIK